MTPEKQTLGAEAHRMAIEASMPHLANKPKSFTLAELEAWLKGREFTEAKLSFDRIKNRELVEVTLPDGLGHRTFTLRAILTEMERGR